MHALDTVLFDLDGTLIDSIELILRSMRAVFDGRPGPAPSDADWLAGVGTPLARQLSPWAGSDAELAELVASYRRFQMRHHDDMIRAYPGVPETLAALRERGHPMAIVTSKGDEMAARGLRHLGLLDYFDVVVGCDSCTRHKPDPEPARLALERLGYEPAHAVMVGDSVHDMACGNAAGVATVGALWGPFSRADLLTASPAYYLERIRDLPGLVERIAEERAA